MEQSYEWVLKCIESCITKWHFETCAKVVGLFADQYGQQGDEFTGKLWYSLRSFAHAHGIEIPYNS